MGKGGGYLTNYPKHVFLILGNEFCERFSFYGMKAILVLFLNRALLFSDNASTSIYHGFNMACYLTPIFGAMLADGFIGKYKTIFYISFIYAAGNLVMAISAIPFDGTNYQSWMTFLGLGLIAIGTGGIKPCVSAFGADQFEDDQIKQKDTFFSMFYMAINFGSLMSMILTPILRSNVECFGGDCYALAFGIPAILMILAVIIFLAGTNYYKITPPGDNIIGRLFGCVWTALTERCKYKGPPKEHWLDYAEESGSYDAKFIDDVKAVMRVLFMYIPLPIFWALYDQQGSRWTLQAGRMDGDFGAFVIQPDLIQVVNPIMILLLVPIFESLLFPLLDKLKIPNSPLQRLGAGMFLAAIAFMVTGFLEIYIEGKMPADIPNDMSRVTVINAAPCKVDFTLMDMDYKLGLFEKTESMEVMYGNTTVTARFYDCGPPATNSDMNGTYYVVMEGKKAYNLLLSTNGDSVDLTTYWQEQTDRTERGESTVMTVNALTQDLTIWYDSSEESEPRIFDVTSLGQANKQEMPHATFMMNASTTNGTENWDLGEVESKAGAVYFVVIQYNSETDSLGDPKFIKMQHELVSPNNVNIFFQVPQYFIMCSAEVLFSVTGLSFAYSQAPPTMKAVLQAAWLLTNSVGNLIVMIISGAQLARQIWEFFLFSILMFAALLIFAVMSLKYVYVDFNKATIDEDPEEKKKPEKEAYINASFEMPTSVVKSNGVASVNETSENGFTTKM